MTIRYLSPDGEPSDVARYQESRLRSGPSVSAYDPRHAQSQVGPEDLAFWFTAPLRTELSRTTDCSVLMAYDQHNRYRPSGPVASPGWVEEVLVYALRHTDPAKLVLGVPFYGRVWEPGDLRTSRNNGNR